MQSVQMASLHEDTRPDTRRGGCQPEPGAAVGFRWSGRNAACQDRFEGLRYIAIPLRDQFAS